MKNKKDRFRILEINAQNITDVDKTDTRHLVEARIVPYIENGEYRYTVEKISPSYIKEYENDNSDYSEYIGNPDKTVFLAYVNSQPAGQIVLRRNWNLYAYIEDIRVAGSFRRKGTGTALLSKAEDWARKGGMPGIMLETQDVNYHACLFYECSGYILGGVDKRLYGATKYAHENALFWYKISRCSLRNRYCKRNQYMIYDTIGYRI